MINLCQFEIPDCRMAKHETQIYLIKQKRYNNRD